MDNWDKNDVQFPRLLAEIKAVGLTPSQMHQISKSMDLNPARITELFDRAEEVWEQRKTATLIASVTGQYVLSVSDSNYENGQRISTHDTLAELISDAAEFAAIVLGDDFNDQVEGEWDRFYNSIAGTPGYFTGEDENDKSIVPDQCWPAFKRLTDQAFNADSWNIYNSMLGYNGECFQKPNPR